MPSDDFQDREAILRRRAFFVTSALTGVVALAGCPQEPQPPTNGTVTPVASVPGTDAGPLPSAVGSATVAPEPTSPKIPPLVVPDDVSEKARGHFERLVRLVPDIHAELDAAVKLSRGLCNIEEAACDGTWASLAGHLAQARDTGYDLGARCGGSSEDAKRFESSLAEHRKVIRDRTEAIQARIDAALDDEAKKAKWSAHRSKAAKPRPCLKFACEDW